MTQRSPEHPDALLTVREAPAILSRNASRDISPDYVRVLARDKKLTPVPLDGRTNLYPKKAAKQQKYLAPLMHNNICIWQVSLPIFSE